MGCSGLAGTDYLKVHQDTPETCTHTGPIWLHICVICWFILSGRICIRFWFTVGICSLDFFPFLLCLTFCCPASIFSLSPASCLVKWQQLCSSTLLKHSPIYVQKHAGFATNGFVYCINLIVVCCAPYSAEGEKYICYNFDSTHVTRLLKF